MFSLSSAYITPNSLSLSVIKRVSWGGATMEAAQDQEVVMASKDEEVGYVMKGKRTKRQRLQSPLPSEISPTRSEEAFLEDHHRGGSNVFSSSSSLDQFQTSTDEDEEEDMANCLILLAQGVQFHKSTAPVSKSPDIHNYSQSPAAFPVSFTATGKIGRSYDYECKTCGRTFPSFQALGGHRASHKKPRAISAIEAAKRELRLSFEEDDEEEIKNIYSYPLALSLNPRIQSGNNKSNKIHECSICGAEFRSGQALGGHMRRHRAPLMATTKAFSLNPLMADLKREEEPNKRKRSGISLDLDLNLPALPEDYHERRESKLSSSIDSKQQKKQQQKQESPHVFSSPALVDCHY